MTDAKQARRMAVPGALAALAAMGLAVGDPTLSEAHKVLDDLQAVDEKRFLETLKGVPKEIWARRIGKGLTLFELQFIREKLDNA